MVSNSKFLFNYVATFWSIVANYIFIPLYLQYLGPKWYGILSVGATIQAVLALFDSGIGATLKREFAGSEDFLYKIKLLISLEKILLGLLVVAVATAGIVLFYIVPYWVQLDSSDIPTATHALQLFPIVVVTQILFQFYNGALWGEDRQELSSILKVLFSLCRNGLVILVVMYSGSIIHFILWQILVSVLFVILIRLLIERVLFKNRSQEIWYRTFDRKIIRSNSKFTGGMFLISVLSMLNYQTDKFLLSSMIPIEIFGYYTIGFFLSQAVVSGASPIGHSIFPQLTSAIGKNERTKAAVLLIEGFTLVTILSLSIGIVVFFNSEQIVYYWTGNSEAVLIIQKALPLMVLGSILQCMQFIPYHLSVANKDPMPIVWINLFSLIITIPLYYFTIRYFGVWGAALIWLLYNIISTPIFYFIIVKKSQGTSLVIKLIIRFIRILLLLTLTYGLVCLFSNWIIDLSANLLGIGIQIMLILMTLSFFFVQDRVLMIYNSIKNRIVKL